MLTLTALVTILVSFPAARPGALSAPRLPTFCAASYLRAALMVMIKRALAIPPNGILFPILPFAIGAVAMYFAALALAPLLAGLHPAVRIPLVGIGGLLVYLAWVRFGVKRWSPETYALLEAILPQRIRRLA